MVFPIETQDSGKVQPWQRLQRSRGAVQTLGWRTLFCFPAPCFARMSRPGTAHPTHPPGMHHRFRWQSQRGRAGRSAAESPNIAKRCPSQSEYLWIAEAASHTLVELHCTGGNQHLSSD